MPQVLPPAVLSGTQKVLAQSSSKAHDDPSGAGSPQVLGPPDGGETHANP
jgi:hypothetical protein